MKAVLYSYYRSSCSYRVRIALEMAKIEYEYRAVHLVKEGGEQKSTAYLELNPKAEVPLYIEGGLKLSQSMAILTYLDEKFLKNQLFGTSLEERARRIELSEIINSGIQPIQNLSVMKFLNQTYKSSEDQTKEWARHWITKGLQSLETQLETTAGQFCIGDQVSAVDLFLIPQIYNAHRFKVSMSQFPLIDRIDKNCLSLPAFQQAAPEAQPDAPESIH